MTIAEILAMMQRGILTREVIAGLAPGKVNEMVDWIFYEIYDEPLGYKLEYGDLRIKYWSKLKKAFTTGSKFELEVAIKRAKKDKKLMDGESSDNCVYKDT